MRRTTNSHMLPKGILVLGGIRLTYYYEAYAYWYEVGFDGIRVTVYA